MILDLPYDIRYNIFLKCCIQDLKNLALTSSSSWNDLKSLLFHTIRIKDCSLQRKRIDDESFLRNLALVKNLTFCRQPTACFPKWMRLRYQKEKSHLNLSIKYRKIVNYINPEVLIISCALPKMMYRSIANFPNLSKLRVTGWNTNLDHLMFNRICDDLVRLKELDLGFSMVRNEWLENIHRLISLGSLKVNNSLVGNEGVLFVSRLQSLTRLDLSYCFSITDEGVCYLSSLPLLNNLRLGGCAKLTDEALSIIGTLVKLVDLDLNRCHCITLVGMRHISNLILLKNFSVSFCHKLGDSGIVNLGCLPQLKKLNICGTKVSDDCLNYFANFPVLKLVNLSATKVTTNVLKLLVESRGLDVYTYKYSQVEGLSPQLAANLHSGVSWNYE